MTDDLVHLQIKFEKPAKLWGGQVDHFHLSGSKMLSAMLGRGGRVMYRSTEDSELTDLGRVEITVTGNENALKTACLSGRSGDRGRKGTLRSAPE